MNILARPITITPIITPHHPNKGTCLARAVGPGGCCCGVGVEAGDGAFGVRCFACRCNCCEERCSEEGVKFHCCCF